MKTLLVTLVVGLLAGGSALAAGDSAPTKTPGELLVAVSMPAAGFQVGVIKGRNVLLARGYEIDLARAIREELGVPSVRFVNEEFSALLSPIDVDTDWDFALAEITITQKRKARVDFSDGYLEADQGVLMRLGVPPVKTLAGLRELKICAERGTTGGLLVLERVKPTTKPVLKENQSKMIYELQAGRCDAVVADAPTLAVHKTQAPTRFGALAGRIVTGEEWAAAFEKGSPLRVPVNRALARLRAAGTFDRLARKWLSGDTSKLPVLR